MSYHRKAVASAIRLAGQAEDRLREDGAFQTHRERAAIEAQLAQVWATIAVAVREEPTA